MRALEFNLLLDGREIGGTSGLKWINVGTKKPSKGKELNNTALATAVKTKTELTQQEVDDLRIFDLRMDDFIMSGDSYFKPGSHGLTGNGFLEKDALRVLGIDNYLDLWGLSGKVVEKASGLMSSAAHSKELLKAARDQVRKAHCELEFRTGRSRGNLARTPDVAGITPLNNFLGPESDPVTAVTQLPKYQRSRRSIFGSWTSWPTVSALQVNQTERKLGRNTRKTC